MKSIQFTVEHKMFYFVWHQVSIYENIVFMLLYLRCYVNTEI